MAVTSHLILGHPAARRSRSAVWAAVLVALLVGPSLADEPALTDAAVEKTIQSAATWIKASRESSHNWEVNTEPDSWFWGGSSALAVLALLYTGEDPRTEFMGQSLDWLSDQTLNGTYTYGTRAHALALVPGTKYRSRLESDLQWLLENVWPPGSDNAGCYGYEARPADNQNGYWDNSNSQYGVLGVWMATDAGLIAPNSYWESVGRHWMRTQQSDGGWCYQGSGQSTGSMTAAGLATLFVVFDRAYASHPQDGVAVKAAIETGLNWLGREYTTENPFGEARWRYYYLYGVERVGRASGYKYFRNKDWFLEGATYLIGRQKPEGFWESTGEGMSDLRNTCFALMFLCHGRAPLLFNKLQHGGDWDNKLRDVAGLTHFSQHALERLLNWQIVKLDGPLDDLMEAPVLYMSGRTAWEFSDTDVQKIREYCRRGGMVLAVAGRDGQEFTDSIRALAESALPEHRLRPLPSDHPLLSGEIQFAIDKPPPMFEVNNGTRTLMLICTDDIAATWNRGKGSRADFELGCNIYNYATDKTNIRSRLETATIPLRQVETRRKIKVALIKYDGPWNVEPYGWTRLRSYMNNETGTNLLVTSGLTFGSDGLADFKVAYVTGTTAFKLSEEDREGLKRFLRDGGTLLADAANGATEFREALEAHVDEALRVDAKRLPADSFIVSGEGIPDAVSLSAVGYTRTARGHSGTEALPLRAYDVGRRLAVIYSPIDISGGLLGTQSYGRRGFDGEGSLRVMRNLLLYADLPARDKARLSRP